MKDKNEIISYINSCDRCFCTVVVENNKPEIQQIKFKNAYENNIILGINNTAMSLLDSAVNRNISITIWRGIKGYQLKGYRMIEEEETKYLNEINDFKHNLQERGVELSTISVVLCEIKEIYIVTPGKLAGELV